MSEISFDRDVVLGVLRTVGSVVKSKTTMPILSNLLLVAKDGRLIVVGTDLDLICEAACDAVGEIAITVPAETMRLAIESFRPGRVTMKLDGAKATLSMGRARRTMPTLAAQDFPRLVMNEDASAFDMSAPALRRLIDSVAHAQSNEETTKIYLCGVMLGVRDGDIVAVATNGISLARAICFGPKKAAPKFKDAIIATRTVKLLQSLLPSAPEIIHLEIGATKLAATIGDVRIVAKLIDGNFPPFERFCPPDTSNRLTVQAGELMHASKAVAATVQAEGKAALRKVRFALDPATDLQMTAFDATGTEAVEPIEAGYEGEAVLVGLNSRLMSDLAGMFAETSKLFVHFEGVGKPVTFRSDAEPDLFGVIQALQF